MKLLLFTGAGVSAELGVPAMRAMAEQFIQHLGDAEVAGDVVATMERLLIDSNNDMEHAIDVVDRLVGGERARVEMGFEATSTIQAYALIREEAEWFVQHVCEQVDARRAFNMWSSALSAASSHHLVIGSTNYDRAIEIAATRLKMKFVDGFEAFNGREYAPWQAFDSSDGLQILKLHGSTDWYHGERGQVFKLRHPMPLFGALEVNSAGVERLRSALVLPSREKKTTQPPFPALQAKFRSHVDDADVAFFVGSSLRDPHLRDICAECAKKSPTFVVTRGGIPSDYLPAGARELLQSSGQFLISTLPAFLKTSHSSLAEWQLRDVGGFSPLNAMVAATDTFGETTQRTAAIETLAEHEASLGRDFVARLLDSENSEVRLNALGLIQASYDREELLDHASLLSASVGDAEFAKELELLHKLNPEFRTAEDRQRVA